MTLRGTLNALIHPIRGHRRRQHPPAAQISPGELAKMTAIGHARAVARLSPEDRELVEWFRAEAAWATEIAAVSTLAPRPRPAAPQPWTSGLWYLNGGRGPMPRNGKHPLPPK